MEFNIRKAKDGDAPAITAIFNHYIKNDFSAFLDEPVPAAVFFPWLKKSAYGDSVYVAETGGKTAGFGLIKQYFDMKVFKATAEPGYFFAPEYTGKGGGSQLLEIMERDAKKLGVRNFLVSISSLNPGSIEFHRKHGFKQCAVFAAVGHKLGRDFDVVWMQKIIESGE
jgi:phosphinothricin acetyltransferase